MPKHVLSHVMFSESSEFCEVRIASKRALENILATHIVKQTGRYEQASYTGYGRAGLRSQRTTSIVRSDFEPSLGSGIAIDSASGADTYLPLTMSYSP
jgi:hypothetical protein